MSCPWTKTVQTEPANFKSIIISQEAAKNLQGKDERTDEEEVDKILIAEVTEVLQSVTNDFENDALLAKMLQIQFDKEYELNGSEDHRVTPLNYNVENDWEQEEILNSWDRNNWDTFDLLEKEFEYVPTQRVLKKDKKMETKQDVKTDTYKLSSKVFNRQHFYNEEFCKYKVVRGKKKRPMYKILGIDEYTWRIIHQMIKDQIFKKFTDLISFDNDSVMIRAIQSWTPPSRKRHGRASIEPLLCSVKVFKTTCMPYEKNRITASQKAEKEAANYARLKAANVPCLDVIILKEHVLVTSYLGSHLSEERMTVYTYECVYEKVRKMMKRFYMEANLIHGNLSEHNILCYSCDVYFININLSVDPSHENAFNLLFRDCSNIVNFFEKKGVPDMEEPDDLFKYITGYRFLDKQSLSQLQQSVKKKTT